MTEQLRNKYSLLKSRSVIIATIVITDLLTLSILIEISEQVNWIDGFYIIIGWISYKINT